MSGALLAAIIVGIIIMGGGMFVLTRLDNKSTVQEKVRRMSMAEDVQQSTRNRDTDFLLENEKPSLLASILQAFMDGIGINLDKYRDQVELRFLQAGITSPSALIYYVFMKKFGLPLALLVVTILMMGKTEGMIKYAIIIIGIIFVVGGLLGADLYITNRKQKRQTVLLKSFPDGLDLILVCVESGLALDGALGRVCKELQRAHPELTKELNKTRMELTLLNDRPKALQNLAERTDLIPFKALVGALLQSEKFGTSLTETLRVLSDDYRYTRMMIAENKAARIPALMTVVMMLTMIPAFVMLILAPAFIKVAEVWKH